MVQRAISLALLVLAGMLPLIEKPESDYIST